MSVSVFSQISIRSGYTGWELTLWTFCTINVMNKLNTVCRYTRHGKCDILILYKTVNSKIR